LSLARRIVEENHDGSLRLVSSANGATFDIILPA
jgi:signal transduction histidine kinase